MMIFGSRFVKKLIPLIRLFCIFNVRESNGISIGKREEIIGKERTNLSYL